MVRERKYVNVLFTIGLVFILAEGYVVSKANWDCKTALPYKVSNPCFQHVHAIQGCTEFFGNLFFIVIVVIATKLTYYVLDRKQQDLMDLRELGKFKDA